MPDDEEEITHGRVIVIDKSGEILSDDEELIEILAYVIPAII